MTLLFVFVTIVTTVLAPSTPYQTSIIQPPFRNTTTNRTLGFLYQPWPRVPFEILVIDTIVMQFISVSAVDVDHDEDFDLEVRTAISELVTWFLDIESDRPLAPLHLETGPIVFDLRMSGHRTLTGKQIGMFLEHVRTLFSHYGPATLTARLLYQGITRVGSIRIFVPFPPVASS